MNFGVIFDMDGTLIDTIPLLWECYCTVLQKHGVTLPHDELPIYRGLSWKHILERWEKLYGLKLSDSEFTETLHALEHAKLSQGTYVMPGIPALLQQLQHGKIPIAIGTSSTRTRAFAKLEKSGLHPFFSVVVTADDVHSPKPDPYIFLEAAKRMNISPEFCVVVEDSFEGVQAARRAGMKVIGYAPSEHHRGAVSEADAIISSFSELNDDFFKRWFAA